MKERRKVSDVLGIKNFFHSGRQLTFTKKALRPGRRLSNGWNARLDYRMRYGLA